MANKTATDIATATHTARSKASAAHSHGHSLNRLQWPRPSVDVQARPRPICTPGRDGVSLLQRALDQRQEELTRALAEERVAEAAAAAHDTPPGSIVRAARKARQRRRLAQRAVAIAEFEVLFDPANLVAFAEGRIPESLSHRWPRDQICTGRESHCNRSQKPLTPSLSHIPAPTRQ